MSEQQNEIKTIKNRQFILELSDADVDRICDKAAIAGLSPEKLLEAFIGDLVNGTYTNGSDERMYAEQWYDRCGFTHLSEKSLLMYLVQEGYTGYFFEQYDFMIESEENIRQTEENISRGGNLRNGVFYPWSDICIQDGDGIHSYATIEEWIKDEQEYIEQEKMYSEGARKELQEMWNDFLKWADAPGIADRMDEEIKKAVAWKEHCDQLRAGMLDGTSKWELIARDIAESGYKPTDTLISNISEFSTREKKNYSLRELAELKIKNPDFSNNPEKKRCFEQIIKECQEQELGNIKEQPHFLKQEIMAEQLQMLSPG